MDVFRQIGNAQHANTQADEVDEQKRKELPPGAALLSVPESNPPVEVKAASQSGEIADPLAQNCLAGQIQH